MRIALISANEFIPFDGFRLILALLREGGHAVTAVSLPRPGACVCTAHELTQLDRAVADAEVIMFSVYSGSSARAIQVSDHLRASQPQRLIVWGGPHCVAAPEASLRYADGVCFAEGDVAVPEFVKRLAHGDPDWIQTPSMAFRTPQGPRINAVWV